MAYNVINQYQTFRDSTGEVRANGKVTFYDNLTTDLASIWSDEALTVAQSNPYDLDAFGRITGDVKYKGLLTLKIQNADLSDTRTDDNVASLEPTVDNIEFDYTTDIAAHTGTPNKYVTTWYDNNKTSGSGTTWTSTGTNTPARAGAGLYTDGYVYNANGDQYSPPAPVSIKVMGAIGDGVADDSAAVLRSVLYARNFTSVIVPKATYLITSVALPDNGVDIIGESFGSRSVFLQAVSTTDMFSLTSPSEQTHSISFTNIEFKSATTPTVAASNGLLIDGTYNSFKVRIKDCLFDGFAVGCNVQSVYWSRFEHNQFNNNTVGLFAGDNGIDNEFINNEPMTIPANGIGLWIVATKPVVQGGDTASADSGAGAIQYRIGNDPTSTGFTGITAQQRTSEVTFNNTHFEFSDLAGLGTVQTAFVEVRDGSGASFVDCHFLNRTPGLTQAVVYTFLGRRVHFDRCSFELGAANVAAGDGTYATTEIVVTSGSGDGAIDITPNKITSGDIPTVTGYTAQTKLYYHYPSAVRYVLNSLQTITSGSNDVILFDVADYNKNSEGYASGVLTVNCEGLYRVQSKVWIGGTNATIAGAKYRLEIHVNGSAASRTDDIAHSTTGLMANIEDVVPVVAGDTISVTLSNAFSGASIDIAANPTVTTLTIVKM